MNNTSEAGSMLAPPPASAATIAATGGGGASVAGENKRACVRRDMQRRPIANPGSGDRWASGAMEWVGTAGFVATLDFDARLAWALSHTVLLFSGGLLWLVARVVGVFSHARRLVVQRPHGFANPPCGPTPAATKPRGGGPDRTSFVGDQRGKRTKIPTCGGWEGHKEHE